MLVKHVEKKGTNCDTTLKRKQQDVVFILCSVSICTFLFNTKIKRWTSA